VSPPVALDPMTMRRFPLISFYAAMPSDVMATATAQKTMHMEKRNRFIFSPLSVWMTIGPPEACSWTDFVRW